MTKLSDDCGSTLRFTGAMVGICAQDLGGTYQPADFDYFELKDLTPTSSADVISNG
jgi:xylan 1,4-beta-xylosidase